ncbi:MAG: fumarylacetoacetate hydrolase family protein [Proteobacteria bacterium]|nr:fumarylacetoacetate hydrolase family protein [Pseudomonadota bacterium]
MKLVRYGPAGHEKPGAIDGEGRVRDLSGHVADLDAAALAPAALARLAALDPSALPLVDGNPRLGVPVAGIGNLVCVGLNYRDHALEAGMEIPDEPVLFMKSTNSLNGPHDPVVLPRGGEKGDWEVELAMVIGTTARYVSEEEALGHVAGYCICNDVSERSFQLERGGQWVKGKSCDTFAPLGPWLVTADEVPDPQSLGLWLDVSGERMQHGTTANMIFGVAYLVSYISRFMTLAPGDVISTGTPAGVGLGRKPPRYLRPGDVMALGIDGLGVQRQEVVASE